MAKFKKIRAKEKSELHPRNPHSARYDLQLLANVYPPLKPFLLINAFDIESIDFSNPDAVKALNIALLKHYYAIEYWDIPAGYLCPPIPGRADYMHHIAELLGKSNNGKIPVGKKIICLDVGVGANCVYPIIGHKAYGWSFIGSEIDPVSVESANKIIEGNIFLKESVECRLQKHPKGIFYGILQKDEKIDLTICNPPFHESAEAAQAGTLRKLNNLSDKKVFAPMLNFGGQNGELWCDGGEKRFVQDMIHQSRQFASSCFWFSTLVSKQANLHSVYETLKKADAGEVVTIPMGQGNKISRIVAWSFLSKNQQEKWRETRWID